MLASDTFRVFVRRNGDPESATAFVDISHKMTFKKFMKAAGKKLGVKATKCYMAKQGGDFTEIGFIDEMKADVTLVISEGEAYNPGGGAAAQGKEHETMFVSVLGAGGVGKSALTLRFVRDFFVQDWDPTIEDAYRKTVEVDGRQCMLELLDTAGQDDFESLRHQWMMEKQGYVFVYSVNSRQSLEELDLFFDLHKQINGSNPSQVPIVLVANKKDITDLDPKERQVTVAEGRKRAEAFGAIHIETSAATGEHVNDVFDALVREVRRRRAPAKPSVSRCCIL